VLAVVVDLNSVSCDLSGMVSLVNWQAPRQGQALSVPLSPGYT
jgi:hypothetical protein